MPQAPQLSLVFPAFEEEDNLDQLIQHALETAGRLASDFEVIVVDDGSKDQSPQILAQWSRADTRVRTIRHPRNFGYGAALRAGLREARGDLVFFSDADLQFDLTELEYLLDHVSSFDIVAGYRSPRRDPWMRTAIAWVWGTLVRTLFRLPVRDIDCAFKVFHRRVLDGIAIESVGAFINTEILVRARANGARIHQVPVKHLKRRHGRQSGANPRVILRALAELGKLYRELKLQQREGSLAHRAGRLPTQLPGKR